MQFFFDNIADFFLMLLEVEMVARKRIQTALAVCKSAPAAHIHILHERIFRAVDNCDIAVELNVIG